MDYLAKRQRFNIPDNYAIIGNQSGYGIVKEYTGKTDGKSVIKKKIVLATHNEVVGIGRCMGKIIIAYKNNVTNGGFFNIASYNMKKILPNYNIVNCLIGENNLYVRIAEDGKEGNLVFTWLMLGEKFAVRRMIPDFEILEYDTEYPVNIPVDVDTIKVRDNEGIKELNVLTGDVDAPRAKINTVEINAKRSESVKTCDIILEEEENKILAVGSGNDFNVVVKEVGRIANMEEASKVLKDMLAGQDKNIDKNVAKKALSIFNQFEHFGDLIVIKAITEFVRERLGDRTEEGVAYVIDGIIEELKSDWDNIDGKKVKLYSMGSKVVALTIGGTNKITSSYVDLTSENKEKVFKEYENKLSTARLKVMDAEKIGETSDVDTSKKVGVPYSVSVKKGLMKDIKDFRYKNIKIYKLLIGIVSETNNKINSLDIEVPTAICEGFSYSSHSAHKNAKYLKRDHAYSVGTNNTSIRVFQV